MQRNWPILVIVIVALMVLATIACCVITGLLTLPVGSPLSGSRTLVTRELDLAGFSAIDAASAFQVTVHQSSTYRVEITVSENIIDYVSVENKNGTLTLGLKPGRSYRNVDLTAEISMPELSSVRLSGAARATLLGEWTTEKLSVDLSGASFAEGTFEASEMDLQLSGSSRLELAGATDVLSAEASGASGMDLANLIAQDADIRLSGASNCSVDVYDNLDANLSGASNLSYGGDPRLGRIDTSGASRIVGR